MIEPVTTIIKSSDKIVKLLVSAHKTTDRTIEMENEFIFLFNSMKRFNQLTSSYNTASPEHLIARIILLRPLVLDSMLFLLLVKLGKNNEWKKFHEIIDDCRAEGVFKQFKTLKRICELEELPEEEINKKLNLFHFDYSFFFQVDSTFDNPKPKKFEFNITPDKIEKELIGKEGIKQAMYLHNLYQISSKYEHSTIVSIKLSEEDKFDAIICPIIEEKIFDGYLNLLKIIAKCYIKRNTDISQLVLDEFDELYSSKKNK